MERFDAIDELAIMAGEGSTPFPLQEYRKGYNYERREEKMNESEPKIAISRPR